MQSTSSLTITWRKPDIGEEEWEFRNHPAKQEFYHRHGISWERLAAAYEEGRLEPYPRSDRLQGMPVLLSHHSYDDYARYLAKAKRGYRLNYARMEDALQRAGTLTLPAPIILSCRGEGLLFAGYRRLCLAWNYGMVPCVWLVDLAAEPAGEP